MDQVSRSLIMCAGKSGTLYAPISYSTILSDTSQWTYFSTNVSGVIIIQGGGGGGGNRSNYGQIGGEGGYVKIPVLARSNFRLWTGKGGTSSTNQNTDNSGYGAHGGAGGSSVSGPTGGAGGTPTILESTTNGTVFTLVAMAGGGGGGGNHTNTSSARGGGGGTWSAHPDVFVQLSDIGNGIYRGTVAGGYGGTTSRLAGNGTNNYYLAGSGNDGPGVSATNLNQYFGGVGGRSNADNGGGGGGGGYGGGAGGPGGGNAVAAGVGGYIQIGAVRWGGTASGGYHNNNCGSGGGGGGSWYDSSLYPGAGEKVGNAIADATGGRTTYAFGATYRSNAFIGGSYGYGGGFNESGANGGLIFLASAPF